MNNPLIPSNEEIKAIEVMSKNAVESKYFEKLGGYSGIFSIAMYAREMGLPVMSALFGGMHNVLGKVQISPQLMNAMIRKAGHRMDIQSDDTKCTITGTRKDTGEKCTVSFSVEDARKAGIYKAGGGWEKYPSDMCFARAMSRLARRLFPDVIGMSYVEGEIEEESTIRKNRIDDQPSVRKNSALENSSPEQKPVIEEAKCEVIEPTLEEIEAQFFPKFKHLETDDSALYNFITTHKNGKSIMEKALKAPEEFEKFWNERKK